MPTNRSFWQDQAGILGTLREGTAPSKVGDSQLLVKAHAWAMNPCDPFIQDTPLPFTTYPLILGEDVAGIVELVGTTATSEFAVGDRVVGQALGATTMDTAQGGFQDYVVLEQGMACKIPETLSFTDASVFPLCINTAAKALFSKDYLGLSFPQIDPTGTGKYVVIWGGSSAVGSNAVQLAKAAGYEVISTSSARNFEYVKELGADKVFDYNSPTTIDEIVAEVDKGSCAGIFQAAGDVASGCQISVKSKQKLFVASATFVADGATPEGVEARFVYSNDLSSKFYEDSSLATFEGFLSKALAKGVYQVAPAPEVVKTKGLEGIQGALDSMRKGVSAKKIVVEAL